METSLHRSNHYFSPFYRDETRNFVKKLKKSVDFLNVHPVQTNTLISNVGPGGADRKKLFFFFALPVYHRAVGPLFTIAGQCKHHDDVMAAGKGWPLSDECVLKRLAAVSVYVKEEEVLTVLLLAVTTCN